MNLIIKKHCNLGIFNGFFELERNGRELPSRLDIWTEIALGDNLTIAVKNRNRKGFVHMRIVVNIIAGRGIIVISRPSRQGVNFAVSIGFERWKRAINSVIRIYL